MHIHYTIGSLFRLTAAKLTENQLKYREQAQQAYNRYFNNHNHQNIKRFYYNPDSDTITPRLINK